MTKGKALSIFFNIDSPNFTELEKGEAIRIVMDTATKNSITKENALRVIRWLWDMVFEEEHNA